MISMSKDCPATNQTGSRCGGDFVASRPAVDRYAIRKDFSTSMLLGLLTLVCATVSFATTPPPPRMSAVTSITLTYDLDKASLCVEAVHPSSNWEIDYVRMMTISINGQTVSTSNYYHQTSAAGFSDDVALNAKAGDVITVDLFCTGGSSMSKDLTITKPGE